MTKRKLALVAFVALALSFSTAAKNESLPPNGAMASITAADLKKHLSFLASDELGGRYTFSPGLQKTAEYLAAQLKSYGYRGAMPDGSFFQKVPLGKRKLDEAKSGVTLTAGGQKQSFKYGDDFVMTDAASVNFRGETVFVGYGVAAPEPQHDDYAGLSLTGKVAVIAPGLPAALAAAQPAMADPEARAREALRRGAAGVIFIPSPQQLSFWSQIKFQMTRGQYAFPPPPADKALPALLAGPQLVKALAAELGKDAGYLTAADGKPLPPAPLKTTAEVSLNFEFKEEGPTQNVVAILDGADPKLKDEYVVFSAHVDHLKTGPNGEVYNGADDDGSGTSAVLEIAQAFTIGPRPKRSVLIVYHTAEELGLYGSLYNTDYAPVVPLKQLVANLNIDMIGRSRAPGNDNPRDKELTDKNSVYLIGADKLSSELHALSEQTNKDTVGLRLDYLYNDESHPARFYRRSDHYNYARHGIPIIFYFTGVHQDYHRPTDDVDKIDFEKMERITRLVFATGWRVLNLDHRLVVDKQPAPSPLPR